MSVFISSIAELSQNFFNSDPLKFNQYFAITPDYQKYCLAANLPTRFTIMLAKEAMLIHDIAIHLLAGGYKLTTGTVKGICAIASGFLGLETDHQTPSKQAAIHFGFACFYLVDFFVSITNINKTYPQYLVNKIETIFTDFLKTSNKNVVTRNIIVSDPEIEQELKIARKELEKRNADFDQLAEEIEKIAQDSSQPSYCEETVDKALSPDINATLARIRNSTKNNQEKQQATSWFENESDIYKEINSLMQSKENIPVSSVVRNSFYIDADDLLEQTLSFSSSSDEQNLAEILIIPTVDLSLANVNKPGNPKIEVKSTPEVSQISRNPKKNNHPSQISARARSLEYDNNRRNRSKKTLAS